MDPFNVDILVLTKQAEKVLGKVTSLAIMIPSTQDFDPDGLYSTRIFKDIGSEERNTTFGYIDLNIDVLHPLIYEHLISIKKFYKDIAESKKYAIWDNKLKDFVPSNVGSGETGISFLLEHVNEIKFEKSESDQRTFRIEMIKRYTGGESRINKWLVLPAGLRDYTIDKNGRPTEDESNDLYRKLLGTVNSLTSIKVTDKDKEILNPVILKVQNTLLEIYHHFITLIDGKSKFIEGKWTKRAITYGTRNVITSATVTPVSMDEEDGYGFNDTMVGLYQMLATISPVFKGKVQSKFINRILNPTSDTAILVDKTSLESKHVTIEPNDRDEWLTDEGLDNILGKFEQESNRFLPVTIGDYYLMLIYDDGKIIEPIFNTANLREDMKKKYLRPITYAELFYISIYDIRKKYPAYLTRYPVANIGGIYPSKLYIRTTVNGRKVKLKFDGKESNMIEYPILKESFFNSISPAVSKLAGMGGDFDGDTVSLNVLMSDDSIKEVNELLDSVEFYVLSNGKIAHSVSTDPLDLVLKSMTIKG